MSFSSVGQVFDPTAFREHVSRLDLGWARSVTIHHTASPDLAMRPKGFTIQHMRNLAHYYGQEMKWSRGPHLFTDEDQIFGLSPLTERGIHAVNFNADSIGIEMLGNYDTEDPFTGRGQQVLATTAAATVILLERMGKLPSAHTVLFHRDDPKTSKTCPGKRIEKSHFLDLCKAYEDTQRLDAHQPLPIADASTEARLARLEAKVFG